MFEWEDSVNGHFCLFQINVDEYAEEQTIMRPDSLPVWTVSCFPWGWDSRLHVCAAGMKQNETFRPGEKSSWEGDSHRSRFFAFFLSSKATHQQNPPLPEEVILVVSGLRFTRRKRKTILQLCGSSPSWELFVKWSQAGGVPGAPWRRKRLGVSYLNWQEQRWLVDQPTAWNHRRRLPRVARLNDLVDAGSCAKCRFALSKRKREKNLKYLCWHAIHSFIKY